MRELSLFTGAGGGLLGTKLLGFTTVCMVERDEYCQRVLRARQADELLEECPIHDDVCTFDGRPWRGRVDIVTGGFPCQPFSLAKHSPSKVPDLWPEMRRIVLECAAPHVFAENVTRAAIEPAAADLHAAGYSVRYAQVDASALGAPHRRSRWWLVGHANQENESRLPSHAEVESAQSIPPMGWWANVPEPLGMDDGVAHRLDRLGALGNGQVPAVAAFALRYLW